MSALLSSLDQSSLAFTMSGRFVPARQLEDEWEYEYDGNEKEVRRVTCSLTNRASDTQKHAQAVLT